MSLALHPGLASLEVIARDRLAGFVQTPLCADVDHAILSVPLAVRPLHALEIERGFPRAGVM